MQKLTLILVTMVFSSFNFVEKISKEEARSASKFLSESEKNAVKAVAGLNDAQLKFKPSENSWSIEECMMHIAASERMLRQMIDESLKADADPSKRSEVKMTDEDVKKNVEDRSNKLKTFPPLEPANTGIKNLDDAIKGFKENRNSLNEFVKSTDKDLRNHYVTLPIGVFDAYQMVLFIGAHSNRHVKQIMEIKSHPDFPKK